MIAGGFITFGFSTYCETIGKRVLATPDLNQDGFPYPGAAKKTTHASPFSKCFACFIRRQAIEDELEVIDGNFLRPASWLPLFHHDILRPSDQIPGDDGLKHLERHVARPFALLAAATDVLHMFHHLADVACAIAPAGKRPHFAGSARPLRFLAADETRVETYHALRMERTKAIIGVAV